MSDELDFEIIDDSSDQDESTIETNEENTPSEENSKASVEENTSSTKGKKSNWKKVSKIAKSLKNENAELRKRLEALESNRQEVINDDDEDDFDLEDNNGFDKTEFRFFTIENPEAKNYRSELESTLNKYPDMTFDDALALVKAKTPPKSETSKDFSSKGSNVKVRKRLEDLTDEEALKLDNKKYLEYVKLKGGKVR